MPEALDRLKTALADRYAIDRELGRGGMATVYLARDLQLGRRVAIKVLRPELAAALGPRFLQEIQVTANLNHPHILPLLDRGRSGEFLYYVMPYAEGESLRDRLKREKQLPLEDALQIAREVADALDYAHARNLVHRDIKPENILLESGNAVVADFGIARAISVAGGEKLTATGLAVGTPEYMSPEQASGRGDVDGRSDIYALGCLLYEMLAGQPPFTGPTVEAVVRQHLAAPAPTVTAIRAGVPEPVSGAIQRALAKTPADRFGTAAQFGQAIAEKVAAASAWWHSRQAAVIAGFIVLAVAGYWAVGRGGSAVSGADGDLPRLAVLPFENLGAPEDEYFADGVTEEIASRLARLRDLDVIGRTSARQYKRTTKTIGQIGDELGVQYLLDGSVRWQRVPDGPDRVRITPQLIRVREGTRAWTERYDTVLTAANIFAVQADAAERVAAALGRVVRPRTGESETTVPTDNLEAWDYYLRGNAHFARRLTLEDARRALEMYGRAVVSDPNFVEAHAGVVMSGVWLSWQFGDFAARHRARTAVEAAVRLGSDRSATHRAQGYYYYYSGRDYDRALKHFLEVQEREPSDAATIGAIAGIYRRQGNWPRAEGGYVRALELDPLDHTAAYSLGQVYMWTRQYAMAERLFDRAIAIDRTNVFPYLRKAEVYLLSDGTVARALAFVKSAASAVDSVRWLLEASVGTNWFRQRVLMTDYEGALDSQGPGVLGLSYYFANATRWELRNDLARARIYYDSARALVLNNRSRREQLDSAGSSSNRDLGMHLAYALAGLERRQEALRELRGWTEWRAAFPDAHSGAEALELRARTYLKLGDNDAAIHDLEHLLSIPAPVSTAGRQADPTWEPLPHDPRFRRLVGENRR